MPTIFRVMTPDGDRPSVGRSGRKLGVRLPDEAAPQGKIDITPDGQGDVHPGGKGMSVSPDLQHLPFERVPQRLRKSRPGARGSNNDRVWRHGTGSFTSGSVAQGLELHPDRVDHGVVAPAGVMKTEQYEQALAATAADWVIDES